MCCSSKNSKKESRCKEAEGKAQAEGIDYKRLVAASSSLNTREQQVTSLPAHHAAHYIVTPIAEREDAESVILPQKRQVTFWLFLFVEGFGFLLFFPFQLSPKGSNAS